MKLNLGCGFNHEEGFINVDAEPLCNPDVIHDLTIFPWPFENDSAEYVKMTHVIEHLPSLIDTMKELYRICKNDAIVELTFPHFRHSNFMHDPTHVTVVTDIGLRMFSKKQNQQDMENHGRETKLAMMHNVDFEIVKINSMLEEPWHSRYHSGKITEEDLLFNVACLNNVIQEQQVFLKVIKENI